MPHGALHHSQQCLHGGQDGLGGGRQEQLSILGAGKLGRLKLGDTGQQLEGVVAIELFAVMT